ncbi:MAG: hypothetical protein LKJ25_03075 [Clostridia bacterium]|jgi:hypothetical protein|nr:hypothetical protein [Clostridia bacterium]
MKLILNNKDITQIVGQITWSGDYSDCSRCLEFTYIVNSDIKSLTDIKAELGANVIFYDDDGNRLFDGFIFSRDKSSESSEVTASCFDRGIYLKRNKSTYDFKNQTADGAAKAIAADFNIQAGSLAAPGISISRKFLGVDLYNIIETMYSLSSESTGKKYLIRFIGKKMNVVEKDNSMITELDSTFNLMDMTVNESIEKMINQVAIYNENDVLSRTVKDSGLISAYGLMQGYIKESKGKDATSEAQKMLDENGISQKITVNVLGNINCITGNMAKVREPHTGTTGAFYIDSDTHTWKNGQYYTKLVLDFKNIMNETSSGTEKS